MEDLNNNVQEPNNAQMPNQNNGGNKKGLSGGAIAAIIIGAIVLFVGVLVGVGFIAYNAFKADSKVNYTQSGNKVVIPDNYKVYESEELGISFGYPEGFTLLKEDITSKEKAMVSFSNTKTGEAINVVVDKVPTGYNNSSYIEGNIKGIKQTIGKDPKTNKSGVKLGGRTGATVEYTLSGTEIYQSITTKDGIGYIFTYGARPASFDNKKADEIFSTFKFVK